jgi:anti-sigma factor RsiW
MYVCGNVAAASWRLNYISPALVGSLARAQMREVLASV